MVDSSGTNPFVTQLLRQDQTLTEAQYKEHRMQLEQALNRAEFGEKLSMRVACIAIPLGIGLAYLGGSGVIGSFDPGDPRATVLSITAVVFYFLCMLVGAMGIASHYTRFKPRIKEIKDQIRDAHLLALHGEIVELRKQVELLVRAKE